MIALALSTNATNTFSSLNPLSNSSEQTDHKCGEGKCGGKKKKGEHKCGSKVDSTKSTEHKCGEGKCGGKKMKKAKK